MSAETELAYLTESPDLLDSLHRLLQARFGEDWYFRWSEDDGYVEIQLFVPLEPSMLNTEGYSIHYGDSNECFS
jgi:hypothetical protein